jgi:hypothetical protein
MAASYGVFCKDCNEVFGRYESMADAEEVARLHAEVSGHDSAAVDAIQTMGDPSSTSE